ncbi:MAG: GNAT family N-acetyltransferase [Clostridia bacterium]|nr:GNAT family N-acetyltransferase [Clostridia bacterium]
MTLYNQELKTSSGLNDTIVITSEHTDEDTRYVCEHLINHNIVNTQGLLSKPGIDINLYIKDGDKIIGAILCDSFNMCLYIDVLWLDETYRGKGYGKALISKAEQLAKEHGCIFSHTNTFSYQAPDFYIACGYEVFATLQDYPNGIVQFFFKEKVVSLMYH